MSSPMRHRSVSRGRSLTPARTPPAAYTTTRSRSRTMDDNDDDHDRPNGTRTRSPSRSRSRSNSYRSRTPSRTRSPSSSAPRSAKIVIEKLTKNVNKRHLEEIFGTYGAIAACEMPMNAQFMTNRGIAYILYARAQHAESAIAHMHEAQLDGALISVSIVLPRRRFSRSPAPRRPPPNRFGEPHRLREPAPRAPRPVPGYRRRSPPPSYRGGGPGYRDRYEERNSYRPRSWTRSRSPAPRRRRSRSPRRQGEGDGYAGRRRRSPSYSSYGSRSRSRSRDRGRR